MKLKDLEKNIIESIIPGKEADVDWNFPEVTILSKAEKTEKGGSGGLTDDSSKTEIIDPENMESEGEGEGEGSGESENGGDSDNSSSEIKIGSIIQDFKTGKYGKVTEIHPNGDVSWEPVSEDELRQGGYLKTTRINTMLNLPDRSTLNGFAG